MATASAARKTSGQVKRSTPTTSSTDTERFTYDNAGNRLIRTAKDIEEQYIYDINNRLTSQTVNGRVETYRYDDAGNLLQDAKNTYEYDAFCRTSKVTTKAGDVQLNRYDAEGLRCEMEGNEKAEQIPNRYQYIGQQLDPITQQYYLRARYYNPAIARFTQEDEYHGDGLNLYAYCANNPVGYYDPSGYDKNVYHKNFNNLVNKANRYGFNKLSPKEKRELIRQYRHLNPNEYKLSYKEAKDILRNGLRYPLGSNARIIRAKEPSSYIPNQYMRNYEEQFKDGMSYLIKRRDYDAFYSNSDFFERFPNSRTYYSAPKNGMDNALKSAQIGNGIYDADKMAKSLGYDYLAKNEEYVRINTSNVNVHQVSMPKGTEVGTNYNWIPGGVTSGGTYEAITHTVRNPFKGVSDVYSSDVIVDGLNGEIILR